MLSTLSAVLAAALTACGGEDSASSSTSGKIDSVTREFETFRLVDDLSTTLFHDFIAGVQPAETQTQMPPEEAMKVARALVEQVRPFIDATLTTDGFELTSVRNPLDLIHREIASNQVGVFNEGRAFVADLVAENRPGQYNTRISNANIQFIEIPDDPEAPVTNDNVWNYPTLSWAYAPDSSNRVSRVIQYLGYGYTDPALQAPSIIDGRQYRPGTFAIEGYNRPIETLGSIAIPSGRQLSYQQDMESQNSTDPQIDVFGWGGVRPLVEEPEEDATDENESPTDEPPGGVVGENGPRFDFNGEEIDCLRVVLNYRTQLVKIYTSLEQTSDSVAWCGHEDATPTYQYDTKAVASRRFE